MKTFSEMFYADVALSAGAKLQIPAEHEERAAFIVYGTPKFPPTEGAFSAGQLLVFKPGAEIILITGSESARLMLIGGEPVRR